MTVSSLPPFPGLSADSTIRIIAPANYVTEAAMAPGRAMLEAAGFKVDYCANLFEREGQFAGSDQMRAESLMTAFADPDVAAIISARGGYGSPRLMELVDWNRIALNPKPFVGYSDLTAVMTRLVHRCGMRAFHGPVMRDLSADTAEPTAQSLIAALKGTPVDDPLSMASVVPVRPGQASGPLVGGNLTMLASIMGTDSGFSAQGAILLLEDVAEYIYRLDRALVQLRQAGALEGVQGVIIADLVDVEDGTVPFGISAIDMIAAHFGDVPIVAGVPAGHGRRKLTLALGAESNLTVAAESCSFSQQS